MSVAVTWGTYPAERAQGYPCDHLVQDADGIYYRGISINAPAEVIYRWLCQLRVAPYSYDWIDNIGRRSPQKLVEGLNELEVGQRFMTIFKLVDFVKDQHVTLQLHDDSNAERIFGRLAVSYTILPSKEGMQRLIGKLVVKYPSGLWGWLVKVFLPWGDLIMMRKQFLNFKRLAQRTPGLETP